MTTILARQAQVAGKVEATPGTEEALVAADAILVYDVAFTPEVSTFQRTPARSTLSPLPSTRGVKVGSLTFRAECKGSGSVATVPEFDVFLRACGFERAEVVTVAIGAVAGGPFQAGEIVSAAPSGATARVVGDTENGDATIRLVELTGTIAGADVLTGGTSGATATASGGPTAAQGYEYKPISDSIPSITLGFYNDGLKHTLVGARGSVAVNANVGEPGFFTFTFSGVYTGTADVAMLAGTTYDAPVPPSFLGVAFAWYDLATPPCFTTFGVDVAAVVEPRLCARNANGAIAAEYTGRAPTASLDPELSLVADFDWYGSLRNGTQGRFSAEWGSVAGNVVIVATPKCQIESIGGGDRNGLAIGTLGLILVTGDIDTGDDELQIAVV